MLAKALVALGEHRGQLAGGQQPVRVGGAGHGVAGLACRLTHHRHVEHHVGGQQPQVPVGGVLVVYGHRRHQPVERQHPGVVGHHQRGAVPRQVLDPTDLNAEPGIEKDSQQRQKHRIVEVRIEAEFVDGVIAHHPLADKLSNCGDPPGEFVRCIGRGLRSRGGGATIVDLAHHGSDLLGRGTAGGVGQQGGMSARAVAAGGSTPLGRLPTRIRVQRNHFGFGFARHVDTFSHPIRACI